MQVTGEDEKEGNARKGVGGACDYVATEGQVRAGVG